MANLPNPPLNTPIVEAGGQPGTVRGAMTLTFANWLLALVTRTSAAAYQTSRVSKTAQAAAVVLSTLVPSASGYYKVSWRVRIVTPASTSSSVQFSVSSTEGGVSCVQTAAAYTGNLASVPQSGAFIVKADPGTVITFSVAYASVGTPMVYDADAIAEQLA